MVFESPIFIYDPYLAERLDGAPSVSESGLAKHASYYVLSVHISEKANNMAEISEKNCSANTVRKVSATFSQ